MEGIGMEAELPENGNRGTAFHSFLGTTQEMEHTMAIQLKKYERTFIDIGEFVPSTPSEWFSYKFPEQARIYGCPFLETVHPHEVFHEYINPVAMNVDFFAAILGGDERLRHKVVYMEEEMQFYFYDHVVDLYRATTPEKLATLLRAMLLRCAEEQLANIDKFNLFYTFRSDKQMKEIVQRAKSILAADSRFFSSGRIREKGPELLERLARVFVEELLSREPGQVLPLNTAFQVFNEMIKSRNLSPVYRCDFKDLVPPLIKTQFGLGLRNDLFLADHSKQLCGWKDLKIQDAVMIRA